MTARARRNLPGATALDHGYLLNDVEVTAPGRTGAVAVVGDSLTDGRGATTGDDRRPDRLFDRLRYRPDIAVLNQGAGGNRVLAAGLGPDVLAHLDRDVLSRSGMGRLIVFEGADDIGTADATPEARRTVTAGPTAGYRQIVVRAHGRASGYGARTRRSAATPCTTRRGNGRFPGSGSTHGPAPPAASTR
ncbi:GDSL-type esterase/lipase family protein [Streptomyces sp. NPDC006309]|uniref:GDSL-type esterase/lipase family protein n=1 Tax=Streptomyces sp. NPDC006309 TaxID=3156749 RepID=UPI0033B41200